MRYRITTSTGGWIIQEWEDGKRVITRGPKEGHYAKAGWKAAPIGYYSKLEHAALAMLDKELAEHAEVDPTKILKAVEIAKIAVLRAVNEAVLMPAGMVADAPAPALTDATPDPRPLGCICDPDFWVKPIFPVCEKYVHSVGGCKKCDHEEGCHIRA